jgi:NADPH:quinone reductase-like Zn-dependent oxidoreductase
MQAYWIRRFGSVAVSISGQATTYNAREVVMRVRAGSLNYRYLMVLKGGGRGPTKLGVIPLSDGAGKVAAIGDGVTPVKVGSGVRLVLDGPSTLVSPAKLRRQPGLVQV